MSSSFKPRRGEQLSVHVESMLIERGISYEDALVGHEGFLLVGIPVPYLRAMGLDVELSPDSGDGARGECHALIVGKITAGIAERLARDCDRIIWV